MSAEFFAPITFEQLKEMWPDDPSGQLAARLATRFLVSHLVSTAIGAECKERSQAESAANKEFALLVRQFGSLTTDGKVEPAKAMKLKPLKRSLQNREHHESPNPPKSD